MYTNGTQNAVVSKDTTSVEPEPSILLELEEKRKQLDQEIANFRAQKEKDFQEFERKLRTGEKRRGNTMLISAGKNEQKDSLYKPPSRTSSSSALNLLANHGSVRQPQTSNLLKKRATETSPLTKTSKTGPSVCQPVTSLDKLNIKGETALPTSGWPRTPPTPTSLSQALTPSSSSSSLSSSPPKPKRQPSPPPPPSAAEKATIKSPPRPSPDEDKHRHSLTGLFTPSYLRLLESQAADHDQSSSALISPSIEDEAATAPSSFKSNTLAEVLPMSSSFPPHVTVSPSGHIHTSKRAYTAPTVSSHRIPSALRTTSSSSISRKPKHVTFRLADSAIVEPSSSYEEGLSPELDDGPSSKPKSGTRSPLRASKSSMLHRTLSPDEEDEEAGVQPGMGMGDVIQRLNDYTLAEATKNGEELVLEVEEEADEDDEDDDGDDDVPMEISSHHQIHVEDDTDRNLDLNYHEHEEDDELQNSKIEVQEDGYFSPKAKHISTISSIPRGNSPLTPYREDNWAELSSSDKDRLLFEARRPSDDGDDMYQRKTNTKKPAPPNPDESNSDRKIKQSTDGGSSVGFFELDEELASPDTEKAHSFHFNIDADDVDVADNDDDDNDDDNEDEGEGLGLSTTLGSREITNDEKKRWSSESASKFGAGSVPIDIVRPSLSVTSSWVGTFGH